MNDPFTLGVIVGDVLVIIALIALILIDKGSPATAEPPKPAGKRSA